MRKNRWQTVIHGLAVVLTFTSVKVYADSPQNVRGQSPEVVESGNPWPFTRAWYAQRAADPPGTRQIEKDGKLWPPYPRPTGHKQIFSHAYHAAHYWPYPYDCMDRGDVHALMDAQTSAGWVLATTLHDYHFNEDSQQLIDAARTQLIWILNSVPPQYRTVYVAQGTTAEMGQLRAASVEKFLRESGVVNVPPVVIIPETFEGRPANEVDRLRMLELQGIPRPRLFLIGVAARSGGGGGGSGAGSAASSSGSGTGSTTTSPTR